MEIIYLIVAFLLIIIFVYMLCYRPAWLVVFIIFAMITYFQKELFKCPKNSNVPVNQTPPLITKTVSTEQTFTAMKALKQQKQVY